MDYLNKLAIRPGIVFLGGLVVLGFNGCSEDSEPVRQAITDPDVNFAISAAYGNHAEIEFGKLAAGRGSDVAVQSFGQHLEQEHSQAQEELKAIAASKNLALPDFMDAAHLALYNELSSMEGYQFDSAFLYNQILDHGDALSLYQTQAHEGEDEDLVGYAEGLVPDLDAHLKEANDIWEELTDGGN